MKTNTPKPPSQKLKVIEISYEELWGGEFIDQKWVGANNTIFGKFNDKHARYIAVFHNTVFIRADVLPNPEMKHMYEQAYLLGYWDGHGECLSKPHKAVDPLPPDTPSALLEMEPPKLGVEDLEELDDEYCAVCGCAMYLSPSGKVCSNGHGEPPTTTERIRA